MIDRTNTLTLLSRKDLPSPYIEIVVGLGKGKVYELNRNDFSIGRSDESDIVFPSEAVSRMHAYLKREMDGWYVEDNGSKNGVQVNATRVRNRKLEHGDIVQVGDFVFRYVDPSMEAEAGEEEIEQEESGIRPAAILSQLAATWLSPAVVVGGGSVFLLYALISRRIPQRLYESLMGAQPPTVAETVTEVKEKVAQTELKYFGSQPEQPKAQETVQVQKQVPVQTPPKVETPRITKSDISIKPQASNPKKSLATYLKEGRAYLAEGDFESAGIAFNFAILMDPRNEIAVKGMQAAQQGLRTLDSIPENMTEKDLPKVANESRPGVFKRQNPVNQPPKQESAKAEADKEDRRKQIDALFAQARNAIQNGRYQEAIDNGEKIRSIEIKGETAYLNEAKQIIDKAKMTQKEEFEPFLSEAKMMFEKKAYRASRDLCLEMLKKDASYTPAKDCVSRAEEQLGNVPKGGS